MEDVGGVHSFATQKTGGDQNMPYWEKARVLAQEERSCFGVQEVVFSPMELQVSPWNFSKVWIVTAYLCSSLEAINASRLLEMLALECS